ncbi:hypothetical protein AB0L57_28715 [Nocardia sp. NPDC052254]|uniref:hypothetical protein n=1 Tax=Nocardia sp. NPDC052254 TaxID=3155681 RepID=UPI0034412FC5
MTVRTDHPIVTAILDRHRDELGMDLVTYRNHVLRGMNYHGLLFGAELPDAAVLAWTVHDLGIWTAATFDYLEPSAALVDEYAAIAGVVDIGAARRMVLDHHRLRGVGDRLTETFRLADRIDVSHGLLRSGLTRDAVHTIVAALPYHGFHAFLLRAGSGWALRHPGRPLPMLRW